ncbi:Dodecin [Nocardia cerradoensis]|uniref:Dodecin n=2 Tax=Nocardia TaxID=1817 RepID=A0A231GZW8_9NOCA|nr:Dodecin [Nocardia cerradoensis]
MLQIGEFFTAVADPVYACWSRRTRGNYPGLDYAVHGCPGGIVELSTSAEPEGIDMTDHTYRVIEIVGTSPDGVDAAIRSGLSRAAQTTHNLDWFEVQSVRGYLEDGAVAYYQVTMKVGFRIEDVGQ